MNALMAGAVRSRLHAAQVPSEQTCAVSRWHIITGEYPPQSGGVADHTRCLARAIARAGARVDVWAPSCGAPEMPEGSVTVHRLPGHFGARALRGLSRGINGHEARILVQYVPHAFGWKAMNLPFCMWLWSRPSKSVVVMFHEVVFPLSRTQPLRHNLLGVVTRLMALIVSRAAGRILVPTPGWAVDLRALVPSSKRIEWMPVCSNVPIVDDPAAAGAIRSRYARPGAPLIGHFGAYDRMTGAMLSEVLENMLREDGDARALVIGENSLAFRDDFIEQHPALAGAIYATGALTAEDLSRHLRACDVMVQPYPDGASSRRTTLMAALAHGVPVVSTSGRLTEPLWGESRAVQLAPWGDASAMARMAAKLVADRRELTRLADAGKQLYARRFDIRKTIQLLLNEPAPEAGPSLC